MKLHKGTIYPILGIRQLNDGTLVFKRDWYKKYGLRGAYLYKTDERPRHIHLLSLMSTLQHAVSYAVGLGKLRAIHTVLEREGDRPPYEIVSYFVPVHTGLLRDNKLRYPFVIHLGPEHAALELILDNRNSYFAYFMSKYSQGLSFTESYGMELKRYPKTAWQEEYYTALQAYLKYRARNPKSISKFIPKLKKYSFSQMFQYGYSEEPWTRVTEEVNIIVKDKIGG